MKLFVLNSKPRDPNGYIFQALVRALCRRTDIELQVIRRDELGQVSIDPNNQSLLVYGGEELHQIPDEQIQIPFGRRGIWFTEDPYEAKRNKISSELFQIIFSNDTGSLNIYQMARHLPLAADPDLIPKRNENKTEKLLFFSGTAWPNRKELLSTLLRHWPNTESFDLHLVANQYVEKQQDRQRLNQGLKFEEPIAISDFGLRAANSLCTLVVGRNFSGSGNHRYARSPGPRLFEAGITGSCQLVHDAEIPDMPQGLEEGKHYLRFRSTEQLVDLLRKAEKNPEPFRAIGKEMAAVISNEHTYDNRAKVLIESLIDCEPEEAVSLQPIKKQRALFISHEQTKPGLQHGGAGLCLDQIVAKAPNDIELRILCRNGEDGRHFILLDQSGRRVGEFRCEQEVNEFSLHHPELESQVDRLLKEWKPQLVHINHLIGFTPALIPIARRMGAWTTITLHDYYTICDSWNLLDNQQKFCGINKFFDDRCQFCCSSRHSEFRSVDPTRRRITMSEALAYAHAVIVPSKSAEHQLKSVFPHLPPTRVIEPVVSHSISFVKPGEGKDLIILIPGNLAINKGYLTLREIIRESYELGLAIKFRILGRIEPWIKQELNSMPNVQILGSYDKQSFASKASGVDLALFLSPWPETYCITFDEWKLSGRACFYYKIGALSENHRLRGLHQASEGFTLENDNGLMDALIKATTPDGLRRIREVNIVTEEITENTSFGGQHWLFFKDMLKRPIELSSLYWPHQSHQGWVDEHKNKLKLTTRQRLSRYIHRLPAGDKLVRLLRRMQGR